MIKSKISNQAGRKVQRMRNILVVLAMFVCTSICLGWQQEITISEDIVDQNKVRELEQQHQLCAKVEWVQNWIEQHLNPRSWNFHCNLVKMLEQLPQGLLQDILQQQLPLEQQQLPQEPLHDNQMLPLLKLLQQQLKQKLPQDLNLEQQQQLELLENQIPKLEQQSRNIQELLQQKELCELWQELQQQLPQLQDFKQLERFRLQLKRELEELRKRLATVKEYPDIAGNGNPNKDEKYKYGKALTDNDGNAIWNNPNNNHLIINKDAKVGNAYGAKMNNASVVKNKDNKAFLSMTNNEVIVSGGKFACGDTYGNIAGAFADSDIDSNMTVSSNTVIITGGTDIVSVLGGRAKYGTVSSNTVTISNSVTIGGDVLGGCIRQNGTVILNKVNLTSVTVGYNVLGAMIGNDVYEGEIYGLASSNTVTITSGTVGLNVYGAVILKDGDTSSNEVTITGGRVGGYVLGGIVYNDGTATENKVNLSDVDVTWDVYGAQIGRGLASSNTVTITSGTVSNVYGGYIVLNGTATENTVNLTSVTVSCDVFGAWIGNDEDEAKKVGEYGLASSNTVTINGGKIVGNVFGGYVGGNGEATYNTINITASTEFSPESILCGGICDPETKSNAITGNTLNIETKGIEVKGISNFEKYKFNLKDIKPGETVLTATDGGCSWNTREHNYTSDCAVDISRSNMNISLHTQGVINKGDQCTLIKSPHGFEGKVETEQFEFENEGLLIKYYWNIKIADNKQELIAKLIDKKIRDEGVARSLSEGYGAGIVCVNNGMDCIFSKMEETEKLSFEEQSSEELSSKEQISKEQNPKEQSSKEQSSKSLLGLQRKGEIGAFGGVAASKSKYDIDKGSHIDMIGTSMMGGVGKVVEVREKELTVGVFAEHGTGNSDINSGLCPCEKKSEGKSSYTGGGLLGRYNIYENELSGTKLYGEAILRAGQVENKFDSKKMKDSKGKEYKYKYADAMYGGCAVGGGYKHKVSEKIDLDWSLRYMFGRQWEKDVKREDADGNRMKFKNVTSNRIRIGVRGKYVELEKIKPYAGIGCEYELDGKVKGTIQNGVDIIGIPASDFGGVTGIGELGVSGKVWKFGVDISGQGYLGVRKGFGGMLKLKYAFGKDAHGSLASSKASSKPPRS